MSDDAPTLSDYESLLDEEFDLSEEQAAAINEEIEKIYGG